MDGDPHRLTGLAVPEELDRLHDLLDRVAAAHPEVARDDVMKLATAVMEVAANVVEHGRPERAVRWALEVEVTPALLVARLADSGEEYAGSLDAPMPGPETESGRGIPLARAAVDEVRYERRDDGNLWTLVRHLGTR